MSCESGWKQLSGRKPQIRKTGAIEESPARLALEQYDRYRLWYALGGIGAGAVYGGCTGNVLKWFPDRRGLCTGIVSGAYGIGTTVTVAPIEKMIKASSTRLPRSRFLRVFERTSLTDLAQYGKSFQILDFFLDCCEQGRRQFGVAFLDCKLLAIRIYPV